MTGLMVVLMMLAMAGLGHSFYESYTKVDSVIAVSRKHGARARKWQKKKARILSVTYNANLDARFNSDDSGIELTNNIAIEYEYMVNNAKTSSMSVVNFPVVSLLDKASPLKAGLIVPVFVNPKEQEESYLFIATDNDYTAFKHRFFIESLPKLAFAQILFLSIIYLMVA